MLEHTKRQVHKTFYNMRCLVMFVTAVCLLFLLKLKWPMNKSVYFKCVTENEHHSKSRKVFNKLKHDSIKKKRPIVGTNGSV